MPRGVAGEKGERMGRIGESQLLHAIHSEIIARDAYATLSEMIQVADGKSAMQKLSSEEEKHRAALAKRYELAVGHDYVYDPELKAGPDYSFLRKSVFGHTQAMEALRLALGAEIDSVTFYTNQLGTTDDPDERRMLKELVKFEKAHQKRLQKEIRKLEKTNHWQLK